MQVCKKNPGFSSVLHKLISVLVLTLFFSPLFAQTLDMPSMPDMPEMPDMPSMSNPTLDGTFYKPTVPGQQKKTTKDDTKSTNITTTNSVLTDANSTDDLLSSFLGNNSNLTANDISSLYDSGLFTNISSLSGILNAAGSTGSKTNGVSSEETILLLKQILASLEELKNSQKTASPAEKQILTNYQQDSATFKKREPSILRFKINGYSITESFTKVFFSEIEPDGSFLFTADRKYFANQKQREETVYILFKAQKSNGSSVTYDVQPSVVQTYKNDASFVYKFAQLKNLTAEKTGNLVVMHTESNDVIVDMLLDIDN